MSRTGTQGNGTPGSTRRTALERMHLARRIEAARESGKSWDDIARDEKVPKRTAQDILRKFQAQAAALQDPDEALLETVFLSTAAVGVLTYEMEFGDSSSARVGAARALLRALRDRLNLLASIGWVPGNVGALTQYKDAARYLDQVERTLAYHSLEIPDVVRSKIAALKDELEDGGLIEEVTPSYARTQPREQPY